MSSSATTTGGDWWDAISVYESDYVPGTFTPGSSVEANHELLAGMRENNFDTSDSAYSESHLKRSPCIRTSYTRLTVFSVIVYVLLVLKIDDSTIVTNTRPGMLAKALVVHN